MTIRQKICESNSLTLREMICKPCGGTSEAPSQGGAILEVDISSEDIEIDIEAQEMLIQIETPSIEIELNEFQIGIAVGPQEIEIETQGI